MSRPLYLIDTHVLLWAVSDDPRLSIQQREILHQGDDLVVSAVSIWEIAVKRALGKLILNGDIVDVVKSRNIPFLAIDERHAARTKHLGNHHRDPFDRLLIAQAQVESLTLLTSDTIFRRYDVLVV